MSADNFALPDLERSQAVIDRLLPLTTPFASADAGLREHLVAAWCEKLAALREQGDGAGEAQAADALAQHLEDAAPEDWHWLAQARCRQGMALARHGEFDAALAVWHALEQRFAQTQALAVREWLALAGLEALELTVYRGATFARVDMVREAERLAQRYGKDDWLATQRLVGKIRLRQGELLQELDYHDQALEHFARLQEDLQASTVDDLREVAADAALAQVRCLAHAKRWPEAARANALLQQRLAGSTHTGIRQTLALAQLDGIQWWHQELLVAPEGSSTAQQTVAACEQMQAQFSDSDSAVEVRSLGQCLQIHAQALAELADRAGDADPGQSAQWLAQAYDLSSRHWQRHAQHGDVRVRRIALQAWLDAQDRQEPEVELAAYEQALQAMGADQAELLQPLLARAWLGLSEACSNLGRHNQALAHIAQMRQYFAGQDDAAVQLALARASRLEARVLRSEGRRDAALAVLHAVEQLPEPAQCSPSQQQAWRRLQAKAMEQQADLWGARAEPVHPQLDGMGADGAPLTAGPGEAELQRAAVVARMFERFAGDSDPVVQLALVDSLYDLAVEQRNHRHFETAVQTYEQLLARFAGEQDESIQQRVASSYLNLAYLQMELLERNADALKTYDALLALCATSTRPISRDTVARANASRLTCLNRLQRQGVDVNYGEQYEDLPLERREAIQAQVEQGRERQQAGQYREAIARYDEVLQAHGQSLHPALRGICLDAMVNKGFCLGRLEQRVAALAVNDEIIARYGDDMNLSFDKDVALALANKAVQLDRLGRHAEELEVYDEIIRRWRNHTLGYLRMRVARALWSKAVTLADQDLAQAEALYRQVVQTYLPAPESDVRLEAAKASVNLGSLLGKQGRHQEAIALQQDSLQALGEEQSPGFAHQLNAMRLQLARFYGLTGQVERQRAMYVALMARPQGELSAQQLQATLQEYRACKADTGWQSLRKRLIALLTRPR